mmetsp:Transcript_19381/g.32928  ORF Transcript_19381/g.32928 Transcript_19381/m.32928 type:complete len:207 (+) Transcript_19381:245-865(+)
MRPRQRPVAQGDRSTYNTPSSVSNVSTCLARGPCASIPIITFASLTALAMGSVVSMESSSLIRATFCAIVISSGARSGSDVLDEDAAPPRAPRLSRFSATASGSGSDGCRGVGAWAGLPPPLAARMSSYSSWRLASHARSASSMEKSLKVREPSTIPTPPRHSRGLSVAGSVTRESSLSAPFVRSAYSNSFLHVSSGPCLPATLSR